MTQSPRFWFMVPVRGGSTGVPRKNMRLLGGKPLVQHVLDSIGAVVPIEQCILISDDDELLAIARACGAHPMREPKTTGKATLDDVCMKVLAEQTSFGATDDDVLLTVQATCPFIKPASLQKAMDMFTHNASETGCIVTCTEDRHLAWQFDANGKPVPAYEKRLNRQELPPRFRESGAIIGARIKDIKKHGTRIVQPINLLPLDALEAHDIDTFADWAVADYIVNRKKIIIRADGSHTRGLGHISRSSAIAYELAKHDLVIVTRKDEGHELGASLWRNLPFNIIEIESDEAFFQVVEEQKADIVFLDILDTFADDIKRLKATGSKVVTFEDLGNGAYEADVVVNDLYQLHDISAEKQLAGVENMILSPAFEQQSPSAFKKDVENILVLFGGTDPANLTEKTLQALGESGYSGSVTVIEGPGRADRHVKLADYGLKGIELRNVKHMPEVIAKADLAFSSAGRTIAELMTFGVPTIALCQNEKELKHTHASSPYGVYNLGLGRLVSQETLQQTASFIINNPDMRQRMHTLAQQAVKTRSNAACLARISKMLGIELL